jgi:hypothetical protein
LEGRPWQSAVLPADAPRRGQRCGTTYQQTSRGTTSQTSVAQSSCSSTQTAQVRATAYTGTGHTLNSTAMPDGRQSHHQIECPEMAQNFTMISIDLPFCGREFPPSFARWPTDGHRCHPVAERSLAAGLDNGSLQDL